MAEKSPCYVPLTAAAFRNGHTTGQLLHKWGRLCFPSLEAHFTHYPSRAQPNKNAYLYMGNGHFTGARWLHDSPHELNAHSVSRTPCMKNQPSHTVWSKQLNSAGNPVSVFSLFLCGPSGEHPLSEESRGVAILAARSLPSVHLRNISVHRQAAARRPPSEPPSPCLCSELDRRCSSARGNREGLRPVQLAPVRCWRRRN